MGAALNDLAYAVNDTIKDPAKFKALNILMQEMINASVVQALQALNDTFGTEDMLPLNVLLSNAITNHGVQTFTSNGTFVVPEGVYKIFVTAAGGGGGGGGYQNYGEFSGGGGGGGACVFKKAFSVTPGQSIAVTIGAGGAGGGSNGDGKTGGSTVVGSLITLPGGLGGYYTCKGGNGAAGGGGGGAGTRGTDSASFTVKGGSGYIPGQDGIPYIQNSYKTLPGAGGGGCAGGGGGSFGEGIQYYAGGGGGGAVGSGGSGATQNKAATAGVQGGGGGGGHYSNSKYSGAAGGKGVVIIEW